MTIVGMLGLMFWLDWDFTLIVVGDYAVSAALHLPVQKAVKRATREVRQREGDVLAVVQAGLQSVRTVQGVGRARCRGARLGEASRGAVTAALRARRVKSLLSPVVGVIVAVCTAVVLWRGADWSWLGR